MRSVVPSILVLCVIVTLGLFSNQLEARGGSGSRGGSVSVRGYYKKDGTYVSPHTRSLPGETGTSHVPSTSKAPSSTPKLNNPGSTSQNHQIRSQKAKDDFKRQHPCPSTGKSTGACPGYVIDHVNPLACGGADASSNMQWQTAQAAKDKDRVERSGCGSSKLK